MAEHYLRQLDLGWETYADLTGRKPATFKQYAGMPTVTAVPSPSFTCGARLRLRRLLGRRAGALL